MGSKTATNSTHTASPHTTLRTQHTEALPTIPTIVVVPVNKLGDVTNTSGNEMTLTPQKQQVDVYKSITNSQGSILNIPQSTDGHAFVRNAVNEGVMNFILLN